MQTLSDEMLETIKDMEEHFSPSAVGCIKNIWVPRIKQLEAKVKQKQSEVDSLCIYAGKLEDENKRLKDGIDKIVAGIRMNTKINYILIMMNELDALKESNEWAKTNEVFQEIGGQRFVNEDDALKEGR